MRQIGLVLLTLLALIGLFAVGLFWMARLENPSSSFQTYDELEASGLIQRGWLPDYLPRSATEIEESHDIDTNEGSAYFRYRVGDTARADEGCQLLHKTKSGRKYLCPPFDLHVAILVLKTDGTGYARVHADAI
jgi:hypothetical protein